MLQHLNIQFMLYYLSSGHLQEVRNKRKFQTFSSKLKSDGQHQRYDLALTVFLISQREFSCIIHETLCSISKGAFRFYITIVIY